jgi:KaiC/GvpD/RAD55 family RecA-like ATPase
MANIQDLVGRGKDMNEIIKGIYQNRFVNVLGLPGIGKTTISRYIGLYLEERNRFKDGIIYISLRNSRSANMLITQLFQVILSKISNEELDALNKLTKDKKVREEMLKDHQPNNLGVDLMQLEKIIICLKDREILVILDNLEDPLINDEKDLKMILQKILGECTSIKFLSTSRI